MTAPCAQPAFAFDDPKPAGPIEAHFAAFDAAHPDVYALIVRIARKVKARGKQRYSMDAILHRVRWHYDIGRGEEQFKINNSLAALYARKVMAENEDLDGFFELRERRAT